MKKTIKTISMVFAGLALTMGLTLTSCKKGDTGPAGTPGINGKDGNANVVSSSIKSSAWTYNATDKNWEISFTYATITQSIIDKGAVLVYMKVGSGYNQLPLTYYPTENYSTTLEVNTYVGGVTILAQDSDLTQGNNPGEQTFKIVVIAASQLVKHPEVDLTNYKEVKNTFNIID